MIKDNSLKRSYRTKIIICLMLILSTVLYACGGTSDDDNIQKTEEKITSEEEITELVAKAIDESEYDLDDFLRVDPEVLDQVLQKRMKEELPSEIEISYFTGSEWKKTLHYCEIAEGSNLSENQKELYREYSSLVEEALEIFYPLKDVYESYGGFTMPSEEYKKFENGRNKMETIKYNYDNTVYQEFYIVNALKNSKIGRLKDIISGDGDLNYYYATNVIDGAYMGDEDYCILTDRTFPERGTYTLLVYFPDYIELESEDGFVKEVLACIVVTENEIEKFNTEYYDCQEKEKEIRSRLTQAKNRILEATYTTNNSVTLSAESVVSSDGTPYSKQEIRVKSNGSKASLSLYEWDNGAWQEKMNVSADIGANGTTYSKREGDKCTPAGRFNVEFYFSTKQYDTGIAYIPIDGNSVWVCDSNSKYYNTLQSSSNPNKDWAQAEGMYNKFAKNRSNACICFNFNGDGLTAGSATGNGGSALFIDGVGVNGNRTSGYGDVKINAQDMSTLLQYLDASKNPVVVIE